MWLSWKIAVVCAVVLAAPVRWLPIRVKPWVRELAVVFALYAAWRRLGEVSVTSTSGAFERGRDLWDLQRALYVPNELTLQRWTLHATWLVRFANLYYVVVHVVPVGAFLAWLFARHRDRYRRWRTTLALSSLVVLVIQWIPVAPPRLYPELGFVDTGALYGPRVYDDVGVSTAGQLSAMPSMHVAWAVVIGLGVFTCARSRWRWIGLAHVALTMFAVTVTAYHWIADGLVAGAVVAVFALATRWWERHRAQEADAARATSLAAATTAAPNR
jgi:hypothetical protein